jgi:hypothetical protein
MPHFIIKNAPRFFGGELQYPTFSIIKVLKPNKTLCCGLQKQKRKFMAKSNNPFSHIKRTYRKTRAFAVGSTIGFLACALIFAFALCEQNEALACAALSFSSFTLQGVICALTYLFKSEKKSYCFARVCYGRVGLIVYALLLLAALGGIVFFALHSVWLTLFIAIPIGCYWYTLRYAKFLFREPKTNLLGATDLYLETVLTKPFYVNGADVFSGVPTGIIVPLLNPENGLPFAMAQACVVKGKDCTFTVASVMVKEGIYAVYLVSPRDYERLCVLEGFDTELKEDRRKNQALFDAVDSPAFHEEGYLYTKERETRFHVQTENGHFVAVEESLFWDRFFLHPAGLDTPYVWEISGKAHFEYYREAQAFIEKRVKQYDAESEAARRGDLH